MKIFLTFFNLGKISACQGTIASIVSLFLLMGIHWLLPDNLYKLIIWFIIFAVVYIISLIFIKKEIKDNDYDKSWIVIDEFLGMMVVYIPFLLLYYYKWWYFAIALILFRFFDVLKPFGIKKIDKLNTPNSVILDDIIAGVYSVIVFYIIIAFFI
ncbi:MAG: phosphatidylglycerophosphatase A [bacterium]